MADERRGQSPTLSVWRHCDGGAGDTAPDRRRFRRASGRGRCYSLSGVTSVNVLVGGREGLDSARQRPSARSRALTIWTCGATTAGRAAPFRRWLYAADDMFFPSADGMLPLPACERFPRRGRGADRLPVYGA
ncbi:MAG: hypothetical protein ACLUI3_02750 [Christensenellales bacterium]